MWRHSSLSWPHDATSIEQDATSVTRQVKPELDAASGRLDALLGDANFGRHSLSEESHALLRLRQELNLLSVKGRVLTVTPYQFEVGERLGSGCYLNPSNASAVLSDKLSDLSDKNKPSGYVHVIALMATAIEIDAFAKRLEDLCRVLTLPDWCQCARQASALSQNEKDKLHQPNAIMQPRFKPSSMVRANPLDAYFHLQAKQIATLESLASDEANVVGKLRELSAKRANALETITSDINALKALRGDVFSMKIGGQVEEIAATLRKSDAPNTHPLTIASLIISQEPMPFFEELLCSH